MSKDTRVTGSVTDIDYQSTLSFFEERAQRANDPAAPSVVLYQDSNPELAAARDEFERQLILPRLQLRTDMRCIDIGCGTARWAEDLVPHIASYFGIDFSEGLVDLGRKRLVDVAPDADTHLQVLSATELATADLERSSPFDLIIVGGVFVYLNEDDAAQLARSIVSLASDNCVVYIREPVALNQRLTLSDHFSEDMAQDYSAVYRHQDDYERILSPLREAGFRAAFDEHLYPESLTNRSETTSHYWIYTR